MDPPLPSRTALLLVSEMMFGDPLLYDDWDKKTVIACKLPPVCYCLHYWSDVLHSDGWI